MNTSMVEYDTRLRELSTKAIDGALSDDEFAELAQLSRIKRAWRAKRAANIAALRDAMLRQGIAIHDVFTLAEIEAALPPPDSDGGLASTPLPKAGNAAHAKRSRASRQFGSALIEVTRIGRAGYPARYYKGQPLRNKVCAAFKALDDGQLESNLARHYTEYGQQYFATLQGKQDLARLLMYIRGEQVQRQTWVRKKTGLVLIEVQQDGAHGFPCRYCKGQLMPFYVAKGWKALGEGDLEANLERHYTQEGQQYFATIEGKAELARLIEYLRTHRVKAHVKRGHYPT